jgi:hypothetical protein
MMGEKSGATVTVTDVTNPLGRVVYLRLVPADAASPHVMATMSFPPPARLHRIIQTIHDISLELNNLWL